MRYVPSRVPLATYRLQFSDHLRFQDALGLIDYLEALGITDAYPSPLFRARANSAHGYDVIDHATIDPEFGTLADFQRFAEELRRRDMGLLMDVVPNHMGIDDPNNLWWQDVLENGVSSRYARFFDIDWRPPKDSLKGKVLLPILGDQYGRVLDRQELRLVWEQERFYVRYYNRRFPLAPRTWTTILHAARKSLTGVLADDGPELLELDSIITQLENLPGRRELSTERVQLRYREQEVARRRLAALWKEEQVRQAIEQVVAEFNGAPGDSRSFDALDALLAEQSYRLSHWRVATDEINYRRFFDINELAALRVEDDQVFAAVHALILEFLKNDWITGLRIDHPDGLLDPQGYFEKLQAAYREIQAARGQAPVSEHAQDALLYLVVEKILGENEPLPADWPVSGTTGYDFLNLLGGLFVDRQGMYDLNAVYLRFLGERRNYRDVLYESKRTILNMAMSSELHVLSWHLDRVSEQHRWSRDFTHTSLRTALRELIACFPVYRSYIRPQAVAVSNEDRQRIHEAVRMAKRRNPVVNPAFFDFIASVLLFEDPEGLSEDQLAERRQFALKFQQVTSPVTAKGMEDTSFYRFYPLASLNEVGGDPASSGISKEQFHGRNAERAISWPYALSATATHDTKRGEDVRARLNVLSECPAEWEQALERWRAVNAGFRAEIDGQHAPDANEEYLIYQTLVGTWPGGKLVGDAQKTYLERIQHYMDKALKEAKVHSDWLNPKEAYDHSVGAFVAAALQGASAVGFLEDLDDFVRSIADAGYLNSLAQALGKIVAPGVPDFYQGTEYWDFSLVDPDNRRPVDFAARQQSLAAMQNRGEQALAGLADELVAAWPDPRLKQFLIWRALTFRRANRELFLNGRYVPVSVEGEKSASLCAFAREHEDQWVLALVPRLTLPAWRALQAGELAKSRGARNPLADWWQGCHLHLPPDAPRGWTNLLTGEPMPQNADAEADTRVDAAAAMAAFPVGLWAGHE
ncbi:MAG: malto-oligosyltrehalose synthase [Pirellulales bacterium]